MVGVPAFIRRSRARTRLLPCLLWYPDGPALRDRARETCPQHLRDALAPLEEPVPGTVTLRRDEWGWETGFHTAGGVLVPAAIPRGGLFATHVVAPRNLVEGDGDRILAWLVVDAAVGPRERARLAEAGWRLGRPR